MNFSLASPRAARLVARAVTLCVALGLFTSGLAHAEAAPAPTPAPTAAAATPAPTAAPAGAAFRSQNPITAPAAAALAAPPATLAAPQAEDKPCKVDADCGGGRACVDGLCEEPYECGEDAPCPDGMQCTAGICEETYQCSGDADCDPGLLCLDFVCSEPQCSETKACAAGSRCAQGRCVIEAKRDEWIQRCRAGDVTSGAPLRVYAVIFDYGHNVIRGDMVPMLEDVASCLQALVDAEQAKAIRLEGHTDERGSTDANIRLGHRRATVVLEWLEAKHPALKGRLSVKSLGESKPLCGEHEESCWSRNRRVEFVVTGGIGVLEQQTAKRP